MVVSVGSWRDLAAPEVVRWLEASPKGLFVDGAFVSAASGRTFVTNDPATGQVLAEVAEAGPEDVERAVAAARRAFEEGPWPEFTAAQRSRLLYELAQRVEDHLEELAQLESLDVGKPVNEARSVDVPMAVEVLRYYAGWATKVHGLTLPISPPVGRWFAYTLRQPVGVVGAIVPWNFPLLLATWKLAPALACGNTVILKPAEETPLTALRLAELADEVGFPPGVLNVICGFGETAGAALAAHPGVDKVAFTGSTETGRKIVAASAGNLKRVSLELGGKSPNIVFPDAELPAAVQGSFLGIFFNQGEVCCAGSRAYVHRDVYDEFVGELASLAQHIQLGHGLADETQMGPLVSGQQWERVQGYLHVALEDGGRAVVGGQGRPPGLEHGHFVQPTVLEGVPEWSRAVQEEIFGPVVAVFPFTEEEEVLRRANGTIYGLAAAVWTRDVRRALRFAEALRAGTVWVNGYNILDPTTPFGGYKQSGYGRELGPYGIDEYTQPKSVIIALD